MPKRKSVAVDITETPSKRTRVTPKKAIQDELALDDVSDNQVFDNHELDEPDGLLDDESEDQATKRTPTKRRGRKPAREETPPQNLLPHERYFWDNRPGASKTSNNTLPSQTLLNHDEYFAFTEANKDPHQEEVDYLHSLHESNFEQWLFELQNQFNICLYGYGSKRMVIQAFAEYLFHSSGSSSLDSPPKSRSKRKQKAADGPKIVVVNGYDPDITLRDIVTTIATLLFPSHLKLPTLPSALLAVIIDSLCQSSPQQPLYVLVNSLDSSSLRRHAVQTALASLAAHPSVMLVATCDTPNFPLMWDITLRRQFRFAFHDCTTFAPYAQEVDVVETVNSLLGRSSRRIGGRDGVGYVLKSLPENARNLYRILVAEQVAAGIEDMDNVAGDDDDADTQGRNALGAGNVDGVEYRVLYHKACEELVCSTEHQFRTLLNEFYDHQMLESRRDAVGTERLLVPFRQEELEGLLEDLVGE